jgi:hypothetical protein
MMTPRDQMGSAPAPLGSLSEFTIGSTHARLVEVSGSGPYADRPGGLVVSPGAPVTAPVSLLNDFIRSFRVDAPVTMQTTVRVSQSPFGAFAGVRRCVRRASLWRRALGYFVGRLLSWKELRAGQANDGRTPLLRDALYACAWKDVVPNDGDEVTARGGDVVVVTFVVP